MKKILMIIDMENDFILPGSPLDGGGAVRAIIPFVKQKADEYLAADDVIIFTRDWHKPDDLEFEMFPPHCIENTQGAEIIEELQYLLDKPQVHVIEKTRYSAFHNTGLDKILSAFGRDIAFEVIGICTNICVFFTVEELRNRDYAVTVHKAGTASFDERAHEYALTQMEGVLGARVV